MPSVTPAIVDYLTAEFEFLAFGPRRFFAEHGRDSSRYLNPYAFLTVNTAFAALLNIAILSAHPEFGPPPPEIYVREMLWYLSMAILNVSVVVVAVFVAKFIREAATWPDLFRSYCYASAIYPVTGVINGIFELAAGPNPPKLLIGVFTLSSSIAITWFISVVVARGCDLHGQRGRRFVITCVVANVFLGAVVATGMVA